LLHSLERNITAYYVACCLCSNKYCVRVVYYYCCSKCRRVASHSVSIIPNYSRSEPINFSFNSLLSFKSPIWTYNLLKNCRM